MKRLLFLLSGTVLWGASCEKKPDQYPPEPQIYLLRTTPNTIDLADTAAMVKIDLEFTDGDGDIGTNPNPDAGPFNIFLKDERDTSSAPYTYQQAFPYIEDYMRPAEGGLEGFITVNLRSNYFVAYLDSTHLAQRRDTTRYSIYIQDDAGNKSNVVTSDYIYMHF